MVYAPIWKDTYYTASTSSLDYTIKSGADTIFIGKAVRLPSAAVLEVNISNICRNFMNNDIPDTLLNASASTSVTNADACKVFNLYSGATLLESYTFLWDWSYENWNGGSVSMSYPVNGHNNSTMLVFSSAVASNVVTNSVVKGTGNYCGKFALYYQNKYGGWDSLLIEGNAKKSNTLTNHSYSRGVKNYTREFENMIYTMDIDSQYDLSTGWLTDEQASNIADNLLQSTRIYAHNLLQGEIFPVVIVDTKVDYKTYKTNSHKPVNYTIKIKTSQKKVRR